MLPECGVTARHNRSTKLIQSDILASITGEGRLARRVIAAVASSPVSVVDAQISTVQSVAVKRRDGVGRLDCVGHGHKAESPGAPGLIRREADPSNATVLPKQGA